MVVATLNVIGQMVTLAGLRTSPVSDKSQGLARTILRRTNKGKGMFTVVLSMGFSVAWAWFRFGAVIRHGYQPALT